MFGVLTVYLDHAQPLLGRTALRLRPAKALEYGEDLFRMAMFCRVEVLLCSQWRDGLQQKRVRSALQRLKASGARDVVLPEKWAELARSMDMAPVSAKIALEACAEAAVKEVCRSMNLPFGEICLAVYGRSISQRAGLELLTLAKTVRTIRIYGEGNGELRTQLWRSCGIVDRGPMPEGAPVLGLLLAGGEVQGAPLMIVDLSAGKGSGDGLLWTPTPLLPQGAMSKLPEGADPAAFAAAFLQRGAVRAREIHVSRLDIPECTQYNKEIAINR